MAWVAVRLFADGDILRALDMNAIRSQLREAAPELAMENRDMFYAIGLNDMARLAYPDTPSGQYFRARATPVWEAIA